MLTLWSIDESQAYVTEARNAGRLVGVVPTMGALHAGHMSLVRRSHAECDETLATIFVNPTQFGPGEDLNRYPRTLESDLEMLEREGATAVFVPSSEVMYPEGFSTYVDPPEVGQPLEGIHRPGHFRGVATVVLKLFHAIAAHRAYFGRKDYQQLKVIEAMVRDLNLKIAIVPCETVREPDGLAMSSRNRYLSQEERQRALRLVQALDQAKSMAQSGVTHIATLHDAMRRTLLGVDNSDGGVDSIDYATIVDAETLSPIASLDRTAVAVIAARVGKTRLIDNTLIETELG